MASNLFLLCNVHKFVVLLFLFMFLAVWTVECEWCGCVRVSNAFHILPTSVKVCSFFCSTLLCYMTAEAMKDFSILFLFLRSRWLFFLYIFRFCCLTNHNYLIHTNWDQRFVEFFICLQFQNFFRYSFKL